MLIGASRERVGFDRTMTPQWSPGSRHRRGLFPFLADVPLIRAYRGFRPYCPDHLPVVGPDPRAPGVVHACGHEGAGIGLAPATGALSLARPSPARRRTRPRTRSAPTVSSPAEVGAAVREIDTSTASHCRSSRARPSPRRSSPRAGSPWRTTRLGSRPRGAFCGIGVCFDCLVTVNGRPNVRACLEAARPGDVVTTQDRAGHADDAV